MRASHQSQGWVEDEEGQLLGVALGFDFCAEHEWGADRLASDLGLNTQALGFDRIKAQRPPSHIHFDTWVERQSRAKHKKGNPVDPDKLHQAALFVTTERWRDVQISVRDFSKSELLPVDPQASYYSPERHDLACAWSTAEAIIWVRGADNVAKLQAIHKAMVSGDLVLNAPVQSGFTRRGGLSFGIASRFSEAFKKEMLEADLAQRRLNLAVTQSGVEALLKENGKGFFALSPRWMHDDKEEGLLFFLNPRDQAKNHHGWFTLEEIRDWAQGQGPVIKDPALIALETAFTEQKGERPSLLFVKAAQARGLKVGHERVCWADEAHTRLGIAVLGWADPAANKLGEGIYDLENFLAQEVQPQVTEAAAIKERPRPRAR